MRSRHPFLNPRFLGVLGFILFFLLPLGIYKGPRELFFSTVTFLEVVALFNILIIVHELGHFLAARWRGLKVEKFAIWFGKPLWSKKIDGVEYILGTIPAGGYVALPQMAPMEKLEGKSETPREELPPASPGDKIIVAFAGPLFSFGLALVFAVVVWIVGKPVSDIEKTTTIGYAIPGGPADRVGLRAGDVIQSINGYHVTRWSGVPDGITWRIMTSTTPSLDLVVQRDGKDLNFNVTPEADPTVPHHWWNRRMPPKIEIAAAEKEIVLGKIYANGPAEMAGLREGDRLTALDGAKLYSAAALYETLKNHPHDPMTLTVERGGASWLVTLQPVKPATPQNIPSDEPQTSIGIDLDGKSEVVIDHPSPWRQVQESVDMVRSTLAALFAPHSKVGASQLSGPVGIMNLFGEVLSTEDGWRIALWLAVVINVNLAMLNLFPFPVLDGGHIVLSIIEWFRRRPLSLNILEPLQTACAMLLIGYMAYITFFDAQDSFKMATASEQELSFQPPTH
jgi:regulator of sigma E protease